MAARKKTVAKKAATKRKPAAKKTAAKKGKNNCAVELGRKGGKATKAKKVGIFSPAYKKKRTAKKKK